jgi:hypothetical protein
LTANGLKDEDVMGLPHFLHYIICLLIFTGIKAAQLNNASNEHEKYDACEYEERDNCGCEGQDVVF